MAIVSSAPYGHQSGGDVGGHEEHHEHHHDHLVDYHAPAKYEFHYTVHDPKSGDVKSHSETRHGHQVTGQYELIDSDGHKRIVKYSADEHTGFKAEVHREPTHFHIDSHSHHHH